MNSVPPFLDADKDGDFQAFSTLPLIIPTIFSEIHVFRCLFVYITMIARQIIFFPIDLIRKMNDRNEPRYKYSLSIFICWLIAFLIPVVFRLPLEISLDIILGQSFYKIWKFYTLVFILQRFLAKVQIHTHKVIRGAIWGNKSLFFPIVLHTICNILILLSYDFYFGSFLAGLYGKSGLFVSALLHIQALVTKKFLPKVLDYPPNYTMPCDRLVMIFAILVHIRNHPFEKVYGIIIFEYFFAFVKFFLVSISPDSVGMHHSLKYGADSAFIRFRNGEESVSDSVITNFPIEVFSIITLLLIVNGPLVNSLCILGAVLFFAFAGTIICRSIGKRLALQAKEEKKAKEEKVKEEKVKEDKSEEGKGKEKTN